MQTLQCCKWYQSTHTSYEQSQLSACPRVLLATFPATNQRFASTLLATNIELLTLLALIWITLECYHGLC